MFFGNFLKLRSSKIQCFGKLFSVFAIRNEISSVIIEVLERSQFSERKMPPHHNTIIHNLNNIRTVHCLFSACFRCSHLFSFVLSVFKIQIMAENNVIYTSRQDYSQLERNQRSLPSTGKQPKLENFVQGR